MSTRFIQAPEAFIVTAIGTSETQITVSNFKTISGDLITQLMIGGVSDYIALTLSPRTQREEQVLAKVNSVAGDNVILDIIRAVNPVSPYNNGGGIAQPHNVNDTVVISNNPALFNKLTAKDNNETVTGNWAFNGNNIYNGNNVHNGTETFTDPVDTTATTLDIAPAATNTQPYTKLQTDTVLALKANDNAVVKLTGNQSVAGVKTFASSPVVPLASGATDAVNKGQMESYIAANSSSVKASDSAFGTVLLDVPADDIANPEALTATANRVNALAGGSTFGTPSNSNKFVTQQYLSTQLPNIIIYDFAGSPHTWTKPANLAYIVVEAWGGGASGTAYRGLAGNNAVGGGGGGAYTKKLLSAGSLGTTETITIGAGGASVSQSGTNAIVAGLIGVNTTFGSLLTAQSGLAADGSGVRRGGNGGTSTWDFGTGGEQTETAQKNAYFGGGAGGRGSGASAVSNIGGSSIFGGGGGGNAGAQNSTQAGGVSMYGGNGGQGIGNDVGSATATAGSVPGGGGGSAYSQGGTATSGAGGAGRVIVTEYYL